MSFLRAPPIDGCMRRSRAAVARLFGGFEDIPVVDRAVMARSLAYLFTVGPTLGLLALIFPHPPETNEAGILALVVCAYFVAAVIRLGEQRLPSIAFDVALAAGTALITLAIEFTGTGASPYGFFYVWVALYAFYFLPARRAIAQLAVMGVAYAVVPIDDHVLWWILTMGTLAACGGLMLVTRSRIAGLVEQLESQARVDHLTGLLNRRGFVERFELELERARRERSELALLIGDLDFFKLVNDRCGHEAGDEALQRVAAVLSDGKRAIDAVCRVGGEEFAILLPGTSAAGARTLADRLRAEVRTEFATCSVPLSMSVGVAVFPDDGTTASALTAAADLALYDAKRRGRDRTTIHRDGLAAASALNGHHDSSDGEHWLAALLPLSQGLGEPGGEASRRG